MQRTVTLEDLAARTGYSTATVSLALRNKPGVSRATRERVLAAAQELGYQRISRPAFGRTSAELDIAVIFRTWSGDVSPRAPLVNGFHSWILTGLQESAVEQGAHVLLATIPVDVDNQATVLPESLFHKDLDGVILVGSFRHEVVARLDAIAGERGIPVVLVDNGDQRYRHDAIETANAFGGGEATRTLIARGHRRIAWFGARSTWEPNFRMRREGYEAALNEAGLDTAGIFELATDADDPVTAARRALQQAEAPTAFLCCNDHFALALLRATRAEGIAVPHDLSIVGFDDIDAVRETTPPLTTMAVDKLGLGRHAMYALTNRVNWPESPPLRIELRPTLIERESVRTLGKEG